MCVCVCVCVHVCACVCIKLCISCSAGVGRTGTFIAVDSVLEQIKNENIVDIAGVINKMRQQRMMMVQTVVSAMQPKMTNTILCYLLREWLSTSQFKHRNSSCLFMMPNWRR